MRQLYFIDNITCSLLILLNANFADEQAVHEAQALFDGLQLVPVGFFGADTAVTSPKITLLATSASVKRQSIPDQISTDAKVAC